MSIFIWIDENLRPTQATSAEFIYDDMESQSGWSLPFIYQPFDPDQKSHWRDRGSLFDYLASTQGQGKRLLDFGPGDGWPALIIAPYAKKVIGVDGAQRRVNICRENARKLKQTNTQFIHVPPGDPLPFPENYFDGVMAASSIEQTPDPQTTLTELYQLLKPGGRLRIGYEALSGYGGGRERDLWIFAIYPTQSKLILFDRDIAGETVRRYGLTYALSIADLHQSLAPNDAPAFEKLTPAHLEALQPALIEARVCLTHHPSGPSFERMLSQAGFSQIIPTHSGASFAGDLFEALPNDNRPRSLETIDRLLEPIVSVAVTLKAPLEDNPMLTAIK